MRASNKRDPSNFGNCDVRFPDTHGCEEFYPDVESQGNYEEGHEKPTILVKIGGSTFGSGDTTIEDLVNLQKQGDQVIVVHGGGRTISEWMDNQGIRPKFIGGLRVTDLRSLDIAVSVLAGLINKSLVASINLRGGKAIGLSGVDGAMIQAEKASNDLGYVGRIKSVDVGPLRHVLDSGYIPVVAPIGIDLSRDVGQDGEMLNINADTVAGKLSEAMKADKMVFLTDVTGVLDSSNRLISRITERQASTLVRSKVIAGGMIPKIEACLSAVKAGGASYIVDGREPRALGRALSGQVLGTRIG